MTRQVLDYYGRECHLKLPGCTRVATTKDHINPHAHGGSDTIENYRPACQSCNSKRQERKYGGQVRIITGPPCAGKTTYANENANPHDVIIDLDRIITALIPGQDTPPHRAPAWIRHVAIGARNAAVARATRIKENVGVWIIHALPTPDDLQEYRGYGWQIITIDPGEQIVRDRIANERDNMMHEYADRWYHSRNIENAESLTAPSRDWGI